MAFQKVTILEFAPTADEIWRLSQNDIDGYASYNSSNGLISFLDTDHDAKPRPEIITVYAGGKATNVARILDRLIGNESDRQVELVTFLPPCSEGPLSKLQGTFILPSTPAGIYVQCLQVNELQRVKPRFVVIPALEEKGNMQATRRCIEITLKGENGTLNFSPRIIWSQQAAESVIKKVSEIAQDSDMVVMAGAPPIWEASQNAILTPDSFYMSIINSLNPKCQVSVDTRGKYLYKCFQFGKSPRFVFMNTNEFGDISVSLNELGKRQFSGTFMIHDEKGCWIWDGKWPEGQNTLVNTNFLPSIPVSRIFSTIGAGDAMHAGFLKEWIFNGGNLHRAVIYSQVVAAVSISNDKATHGIDAGIIQDMFNKLMT